ncbi:hypothetical protein BD289DRAFT_432946 [Coniella lustricola]|uniref:CCHC-type domain-containing protein n=1 Tax=Coniella lustricola TaxID=2025994 RepID=A0A2T3A938_9PEZI|nr:hypothetical protein BD289DRAFT_432946 [Coniella lustricola]
MAAECAEEKTCYRCGQPGHISSEVSVSTSLFGEQIPFRDGDFDCCILSQAKE